MQLPRLNWWLISILGFVLLLRVPSWFEPHWYGDEEIYLALGQMMRRGAVLYRDIWDNKTPLLYLLYAISPTLIWAKLSATAFVLGSVLAIYKLSQKIFADKSEAYSLLPAALIGTLSSLPLLEGNIANAELYFTWPIILGALLIHKALAAPVRLQTSVWLGLLAAIAFLFKVPAIFDFIGLITAYLIINFVDGYRSTTRDSRRLVWQQAKFCLSIAVSFGLLFAVMLLYFRLNHALSDFLTAAFSQNASYVAIDSGSFSKLSNPLFVKALLLLVGTVLLAGAYFKKFVSKESVLLALWFGFSLYGALLSNRPYNHYLLQALPPAVILILYLTAHLKRYWVGLILVSGILCAVFWQFKGAFALNSRTYYQNFFDWASERKQWDNYINYFDGRTGNYYSVANLIKENTKPNDPIFVWGDAAAIYTISKRPAVTKFIQAHHLTTVDRQNYDMITVRLLKYQPKYIVVSRPAQFPFPGLEMLLANSYKQVAVIDRLYVYRNISPITPPVWQPQIN